MGMEYRIDFTPTPTTVIDRVLRLSPYFIQTIELNGRTNYEYRLPNNTASMPNALASTEPYGIYFCDFGSAGDIMVGVAQNIHKHIATPNISDLEE